MKKILEIKNLDIGYQTVIQKDINAELYEGQFICLIGANGIGKSTFLKTISKEIEALSGSIFIKDKNITSLKNNQLSKMLSLVLTDQIDGFNLSAFDVIQMGRYPYNGFWGKLNNQDYIIIDQVADQIGIRKLLERQYNELSDGEKQKVMIAKALVQQAPLMLLDEPTAFLDFPTKSSLLILLSKLAKQNSLGIILSTHDIELALKTADQIWMFTEAKKLIKGIPEDLVLDGQINRVFKSNDLQFNENSGHFERLENLERSVNLIGDSLPILWLEKALYRNNIGINKTANIRIHFEDQFVLSDQKIAFNHCNSIEEVLIELKKVL